MAVFISLLRGINVSGQRMISMAHLKQLYESLGYEEVGSYVQTGNLLFEASAKEPAKHALKIEKAIAAQLGHEVTVFVKSASQWSQIVNRNPLANRKGIDPQFLHATFLQESPGTGLEELKLPLQSGEAVQCVGDVLYLYCPNGYGRTRINNAFFERKLSTRATTRNWRTVLALNRLAGPG